MFYSTVILIIAIKMKSQILDKKTIEDLKMSPPKQT